MPALTKPMRDRIKILKENVRKFTADIAGLEAAANLLDGIEPGTLVAVVEELHGFEDCDGEWVYTYHRPVHVGNFGGVIETRDPDFNAQFYSELHVVLDKYAIVYREEGHLRLEPGHKWWKNWDEYEDHLKKSEANEWSPFPHVPRGNVDPPYIHEIVVGEEDVGKILDRYLSSIGEYKALLPFLE